MKPETRKRIREYVELLPPGAILMRNRYPIRESPTPVKRVVPAVVVISECLRIIIASTPVWVPPLAYSIMGKETGTSEQLQVDGIALLGYGYITHAAQEYLDWRRGYLKRQAKIDELYPPKTHPTHESGQQNGQTGEADDLEKRL